MSEPLELDWGAAFRFLDANDGDRTALREHFGFHAFVADMLAQRWDAVDKTGDMTDRVAAARRQG